MWKDVYADFSGLPKHEQIKLFKLLKEDFLYDDERIMTDAFTSIRETRFKEGLGCSYCGSVKVKRNNLYYWFSFLQKSKKIEDKERINQMLLGACQNSNIITVKYLREI